MRRFASPAGKMGGGGGCGCGGGVMGTDAPHPGGMGRGGRLENKNAAELSMARRRTPWSRAFAPASSLSPSAAWRSSDTQLSFSSRHSLPTLLLRGFLFSGVEWKGCCDKGACRCRGPLGSPPACGSRAAGGAAAGGTSRGLTAPPGRFRRSARGRPWTGRRRRSSRHRRCPCGLRR
jgi:hypothetical protein